MRRIEGLGEMVGADMGLTRFRSGRILSVTLLGSALLGTVATAEDVGRSTSQLLTDVSQADDCSTELQAFNEDIMVHGRIAAASRAFEQCVDTEVRTRYRKCDGDPHYSSNLETQIRRVIEVSRSTNRIHIFCTGGSGNASAALGEFGHVSDEAFSWGDWLAGVYETMSKTNICTAAERRGPDRDCRWADYPWPYSQAAGIVWHEVMHTHGYTHGANSQPPADRDCGYDGDSTWHFQVNTMPYILGDCIDAVITRSGDRCGDITDCPASNQRRVIVGYDETRCSCINDPGQKGLGILTLDGRQLTATAVLPAEDWVGGWHYGSQNRIAGSGDFDGDGLGDILLTSGWGIGIISFDGGRWRELMVEPNGTRFGGWNYQSADNQIQSVGDFDGDGRTDVLLTSGWGVGILALDRSSMDALLVKPNGTRFGRWTFQSADNRIEGAGDFNGDGRSDVVVTSGWGIGILTLRGSSMSALLVEPNGTRFGGWQFQSRDNTIEGIGDFNGDGRSDILVTSDWGMGVLTVDGSSPGALMVKRNGTRLGGWNLQSRQNQIEAIGDLNGDGRSDIVVTSDWGIGVLTLSGSSMSTLLARPSGTRFGRWNYQSSENTLGPTGDLDGDGDDDVVVRSGWGLGVLGLAGSTFVTLDAGRNDRLFGSWLLTEDDSVATVGDLDPASAGVELLLQKAP